MSSGKWYWEGTYGQGGTAGSSGFGIAKQPINLSDAAGQSNAYVYHSNGNKYVNGSVSAFGATYTTGDIIGIAFNADTGELFGYKNGILQGTITTGLTTGPYFAIANSYNSSSWDLNFGQRAFAYQTPGTNRPAATFLALCDTNLPAPLVAKPNTVMDVVTYTGTGSNLTLPNGSSTPTSIAFTPDFVWLKGRSGATDHALYDAVRGVQKEVSSNNTSAETTETTGLTAFGTNTFTVGSLARLNTSSATYVAWAWNAGGSTVTNTAGSITSQVRANPTAGVSIVSYTGIGAGQPIDTIGHGLGVSPVMVLAKNRDIDNFLVTRSDFPNPLRGHMYLNSTAGVANVTVDAFSFSSTTVGLRQSSMCSAAGQRIILYVFAPVVGYSAFGRYTGNGSTDGPFVYTGFRPRWILFKKSSASQNWHLIDTARDPYNIAGNELYPDLSLQESGGYGNVSRIDVVSNGFKIRTSNDGYNGSAGTYIFAAFAENPFQYARAR